MVLWEWDADRTELDSATCRHRTFKKHVIMQYYWHEFFSGSTGTFASGPQLRQRINGVKQWCKDRPDFRRLGIRTSDTIIHLPGCSIHFVLCCRENMYDKITEFWVTVRERGSREDVEEQEEKTTSTAKAITLNSTFLFCEAPDCTFYFSIVQ